MFGNNFTAPFRGQGHNPASVMLQFLNNGGNPQQLAEQILQQNPQAQQVLQQMRQQANGQSPKDIALQLARQRGIDPSQIMQVANKMGLK